MSLKGKLERKQDSDNLVLGDNLFVSLFERLFFKQLSLIIFI